jgi:hypothetical protein
MPEVLGTCDPKGRRRSKLVEEAVSKSDRRAGTLRGPGSARPYHRDACQYWESHGDRFPTSTQSTLDAITGALERHGVIVFWGPRKIEAAGNRRHLWAEQHRIKPRTKRNHWWANLGCLPTVDHFSRSPSVIQRLEPGLRSKSRYEPSWVEQKPRAACAKARATR